MTGVLRFDVECECFNPDRGEIGFAEVGGRVAFRTLRVLIRWLRILR